MKLFMYIKYSVVGSDDDPEIMFVPGWDIDSLLESDCSLVRDVEELPSTQKMGIEINKFYFNDGVEAVDTPVTPEELDAIITYVDEFIEKNCIELYDEIYFEAQGGKE